MNRIALLIGSFLAIVCLRVETARAQSAPSPNQQARFLAGLSVDDPTLQSFARSSAYSEHSALLGRSWAAKEQNSLSRVRQWAQGNAGSSYSSSAPVYYMFSGPDFLYADTFFPNASTFILCGTEPVGTVKIDAESLPSSLAQLRNSLSTMLSFHYFITKEMRTNLQVSGTLPILYVFLARLGCTINDVSFLNSPAPGVQIGFSGKNGRRQTLYYFKTNLSNGSSGGFLRWCASHGPGMSLLKAGSYLLHSDEFSQVRSFLLENSRVIIQDDSGIPLRFLEGRSTVALFGRYSAPIDLFAKHYQPDLAAAYQSSNPRPLGFAFGYHWEANRGMLMLATRK